MTNRNQVDMFGAPLPTAPHNHTDTSKEAAELVRPSVNAKQKRILDFLKLMDGTGATRDQIETALDIPGNTVRPRIKELIDAGLVAETLETRKTQRDRNAVVLVAVRFKDGE